LNAGRLLLPNKPCSIFYSKRKDPASQNSIAKPFTETCSVCFFTHWDKAIPINPSLLPTSIMALQTIASLAIVHKEAFHEPVAICPFGIPCPTDPIQSLRPYHWKEEKEAGSGKIQANTR
jgi:hypothetical protein